MPDEKKEADKTAVESDTQEKKTTETTDEVKKETSEEEVKIDYDKEFQESVEQFERAEQNRTGYQKRKANKTGKAGEEEESEDETPTDVEAQVAAALAKELPKFIPKLQNSLAEDTIETLLTELSGGNESKKKMLRWNFENKVSANGTIRERMENALLITDKKAIQKRQTELTTALQNRSGLGASGLGSSTEGQQVSDNILSADQIADLKSRGWDDKKIATFKKNLRR